jgi:MFS family permease
MESRDGVQVGGGAGRIERDWTLILASMFLMEAGFATYQAIFTNFVADDLHISAQNLGLIESLREVPGFLTVVLAALTVRIRESRVTAMALFVMGLGMMGYTGAHSLLGLVGTSVFWSLGFHLFSPLSNGLVLGHATTATQGRRMGQFNTAAAIGLLLGTGAVFALVGPLGLRGSFLPAGAIIILGAVCLMLLRDKEAAPRVRIIFRRRYLIYYTLTMLDGSRRQIFMTFAVFLLVRNYHVDVRTITALLLVNTVATMIASMPIGRMIDRFGERRLLVGNYLVLVFLFAGYALVHTVLLLGILYCLDNVLFGFSTAITTYLGKIAPRHEVTPSLAMGSTANHVAAVGVPVLGGVIWSAFGYQVTFFAGAATCLISVLVALAINLPALRPVEAAA